MEEHNMTQGEKIALLRKNRGMTQAELGRELSVSYQAVSKWERDESYPDFDTISRIAKLFGVPIQYFENGVGSEVLKESAPAHVESAATPVREPKLLGLCKVCGKAIYEGDEARTNQGLMCKACLQKKRAQAEEAKKQAEIKQEAHMNRARWRRNAGLITAAIVSVLLCVFGAMSEGIGVGLVLLLFAFTYTAQLFWNGAVKECTFAGGKVIGTPGVIFTFDLDGFIFLIAMKILFAVLKFIVWLLTVVVCALAAIVISPFTFVPALIRVHSGDIDFDD